MAGVGGNIRAEYLHQAHLARLLLLGADGVSQQAAEQAGGVGGGICQGALTGGDHLHQAHLLRLLLLGAGGVSQQAAEQVLREQGGICQGRLT